MLKDKKYSNAGLVVRGGDGLLTGGKRHYVWAWRANKFLGMVKLQANQASSEVFSSQYGDSVKMVCNLLYIRTGSKIVTTGFLNLKTKVMQIPEMSMVVNCSTNCFRDRISKDGYRKLQNKR